MRDYIDTSIVGSVPAMYRGRCGISCDLARIARIRDCVLLVRKVLIAVQGGPARLVGEKVFGLGVCCLFLLAEADISCSMNQLISYDGFNLG